jgi:hypothetical protein
MSNKFNIALAAVMVAILCSPATAFDQSGASARTQALRQLEPVKAPRFKRTVQGVHGEAGGYVQSELGRGYGQTQAYPQQTCNYVGGNGGPLRVCW